MARKPKPSGRLNKGPFTFKDFERVLLADGWKSVRGTKHKAYEHPDKPGKVNLDDKWEHVKYGSEFFASVASQAGMKPRALLRKLNG